VSSKLKAGVIGDPINHSLSPAIFQILAPTLSYEKILVPPDSLEKFVQEQGKNYLGWNVTLPHKETIIPHLKELSKEAEAIGAVNVVHNSKGYNTDYLGVRETLREAQVDLKGKNALIYGAGGAARGVVYALKEMNAGTVYVYNRTPGRAKDLGVRVDSVEEVKEEISLVVNTVAGGELILPKNLADKVIGFDLLYYSKVPPFSGIKTLSGLDMLIWQAIYTFEIWFGPLKDKKHMKEVIRSKISI